MYAILQQSAAHINKGQTKSATKGYKRVHIQAKNTQTNQTFGFMQILPDFVNTIWRLTAKDSKGMLYDAISQFLWQEMTRANNYYVLLAIIWKKLKKSSST